MGSKEDYWVHPALGDDFNEGIVWLLYSGWRPKLQGLRRVVRIVSFVKGSKPVFCEAVWADERYLERWIENFDERRELFNRSPVPAGQAAKDLDDRKQTLEVARAALWAYRTKGRTTPPLVFMGQWHRRRLGLTVLTRDKVRQHDPYDPWSLEITIGKFPRSIWWQFRAGVEHPQLVVVLATVLAIVGLGVGVIGLGLGLIAIPYENVLGQIGVASTTRGTVGGVFESVG